MKIHLLQPYKMAITLQAINEGFARPKSQEGTYFKNLRKYVNDDLIAETLQLCVLYDDISMFWAELPEKVAEKRGFFDYITSTGLKELEIVQFLEIPVRKGVDIRGAWKFEHTFLDLYQDFVLAQLSIEDRLPFHWSLFRLLRAKRLGYNSAIPIILQTIPKEYYSFANDILSDPPWLIEKVDLPIISISGELRLAFDHAIKNGYKIAGVAPQIISAVENTQVTNSPALIWKFVLDTLLGENILFPVPTSLKEVLKFRNSSEIKAFRSFLFPFIDSVIEGDIETIFRLRKETLSVARHFKRFPVVKKIGNYAGYTSLGLSAVEALMGSFGPSLVFGLVPLGLEKLAKRWEKVGSWLYLAKNNDNS